MLCFAVRGVLRLDPRTRWTPLQARRRAGIACWCADMGKQAYAHPFITDIPLPATPFVPPGAWLRNSCSFLESPAAILDDLETMQRRRATASASVANARRASMSYSAGRISKCVCQYTAACSVLTGVCVRRGTTSSPGSTPQRTAPAAVVALPAASAASVASLGETSASSSVSSSRGSGALAPPSTPHKDDDAASRRRGASMDEAAGAAHPITSHPSAHAGTLVPAVAIPTKPSMSVSVPGGGSAGGAPADVSGTTPPSPKKYGGLASTAMAAASAALAAGRRMVSALPPSFSRAVRVLRLARLALLYGAVHRTGLPHSAAGLRARMVVRPRQPCPAAVVPR